MNLIIQVALGAGLILLVLVWAAFVVWLSERLEARYGQNRANLATALIAIATGLSLPWVLPSPKDSASIEANNNTVVVVGSLQPCQ